MTTVRNINGAMIADEYGILSPVTLTAQNSSTPPVPFTATSWTSAIIPNYNSRGPLNWLQGYIYGTTASSTTTIDVNYWGSVDGKNWDNIDATSVISSSSDLTATFAVAGTSVPYSFFMQLLAPFNIIVLTNFGAVNGTVQRMSLSPRNNL